MYAIINTHLLNILKLVDEGTASDRRAHTLFLLINKEMLSFVRRGETLHMPMLEAPDQITPRSVIRHRPIGNSKAPLNKRSMVTVATTPVVQRASRPRPTDIIDGTYEWESGDEAIGDFQHSDTQSTEGRALIVPKTQLPTVRKTTQKSATQHAAHPLLYLGIGMLVMLVLWATLSTAFGWLNGVLNDIHYGRPRTFQTDAWVGHNEQTGLPSHFIAINFHRHIEIIEMPGGDASRSHIYLGPLLYGPGDELVPVTLKFVDINGDQKPDMIVTFQGSQIVFINDQGGFRPILPSERHMVETFLQLHPSS